MFENSNLMFYKMNSNLLDFIKSCPEGKCICTGYPRINTKEALLIGKVTLDQCRDACHKNHLCFGFEFWGEEPRAPNCFRCGTVPGMKKLIEVVAKKGNANYATVYLKKVLHLQPGGNVFIS